MTKVDVEETPLKVGDFVWAAINDYCMMNKYEIIGETNKTVTLKQQGGISTFKLYECEKKVLKVNS